MKASELNDGDELTCLHKNWYYCLTIGKTYKIKTTGDKRHIECDEPTSFHEIFDHDLDDGVFKKEPPAEKTNEH